MAIQMMPKSFEVFFGGKKIEGLSIDALSFDEVIPRQAHSGPIGGQLAVAPKKLCDTHCVGSENRCRNCLQILHRDSHGNAKKLPVGGRFFSLRATARVVPSLGRAWPYFGNVEKVWLHLNHHVGKDDVFWVRIAFADATWKTIEKDYYDLRLEEANAVYDRLSRWIGSLGCAPSIEDLRGLGFGYG